MNSLAPFAVYGLVLDSDVEIPGAAQIDALADATLRLHPHGADLTDGRPLTLVSLADEPGPPCSVYRDGAGVTLRYDGVGDIRIAGSGRAIDFAPETGYSPPDALDLLLSLPMAYLLFLRGALPLHACAIAWGGRAVAVMAPSLTGKSTLAAACLRDGAMLISDDLLPLRPPDEVDPAAPTGPYLADSAPMMMRLAQRSVEAVAVEGARLVRPTPPGWKHLYEVPQVPPARVEMAAIVLLERIEHLQPGPFSLTPAEAVARLSGQIFGLGMLDQAEQRDCLQRLANLVDTTPLLGLRIANNLDALPAAVREVRSLAEE